MIKLLRTNSENTDFLNLVALLDIDLKLTNGAEQDFFEQYNKVDKIKNVVVAYSGHEPVGCGAFKKYNEFTVEIKRMFIKTEFRGQGISFLILSDLENWAIQNNYRESILETGKRQFAAIALYGKAGYSVTPNYGQYINIASSICMHKMLSVCRKI